MKQAIFELLSEYVMPLIILGSALISGIMVIALLATIFGLIICVIRDCIKKVED